MPAPTISIQMTFANLPEGWEDTPQAFIEWLSENATFTATGAFLSGQIGGARPTSNVGIFVNGTTIEIWKGTKYVPLSTVPVGVVFDYPSEGGAPDDYMFCENQLLVKDDFLDLFSVLGRTFCRAEDPSDKFRLPDFRGRVAVGAGGGFYKTSTKGDNGLITPRTVGDYFGAEWLVRALRAVTGAGTPRFQPELVGTPQTGYVVNATNIVSTQNPSLAVRKIIRVR